MYFQQLVYNVDESSGSVELTVLLTSPVSSTVTVEVVDEPGNATGESNNMRIIVVVIFNQLL